MKKFVENKDMNKFSSYDKKTPVIVKSVLVKEWFEKDKNGIVFMYHEFQDGKRIIRKTPYTEIPYVKVTYEPKYKQS